ncbi:putative RNA recognition motif domain, nucleotide-binding alpha-beta plait domain superfamily [Helianthus annuus]|uniref:RNA recognition motif domain, nucleotide-binding alpha-beta plait domain superfamily n=1 Tax=Helianthus annuus TaxID=4232 RepID=A0A9K3HZB8_HELAN|nr:putative RNA recognition motif domain, nucleotide-binding alpha-beta plait domain superfamily [Helianthus annuus]KAJ0514421.1 putative RNA recognition motif domain, nucleotide-binding alpha-beta plait domain superfamily [Helianthus annuus]KAJ0522598.1 putative RNA recognition motif domain, nucleotide-binding alpha-beta plait domain superfamily [Helianthus annuus]
MNVGEDGGVWHDVPSKKGLKKKEGARDKFKKESITKFFITNLPPGCNPWDVADFVRVFREVSGVYIARKADKLGRKFGFVSFSNVRDVKDMERALNGTKMGGFKLHANLARFAKENQGMMEGHNFNGGAAGKGKKVQVPLQNNIGKPQQNSSRNLNCGVNTPYTPGNGRLFSDLFKDDSRKPFNASGPVSGEGLVIKISDETVVLNELIGKALVGRCKNLTVLRKLNSLLLESGSSGLWLSYMGGLSMLLNFAKEELCAKFLLDHHTWKDWFTSLDHWNCQSLPFERLAWVKIQGVPMHLAANDVLNNIAEHFGKIVHGSQLEVGDNNLSVSWIGLLVGDGNRIQGHVTLKWKNMQFRVWVEEGSSDWVPDSVGPVEFSDVSRPGRKPGSDPEPFNVSEEEDGSVGEFNLGETQEFDNQDITTSVGDVSIPKGADPPHFCDGAIDKSTKEGSNDKDIYYFNSRDSGRPTKEGLKLGPGVRELGLKKN